MLTGNRGEWSEVYAFFKILSEGKLYPGDANLNRINNFFYPVISVLREELTFKRTYSINNTNIIITDGVNPPITMPVSSFVYEAKSILRAIQNSVGASFSIDQAQTFLNDIGCYTIKANSTKKEDIVINIHDPRTNLQPILGFSIKSKLGGASTLLNASTATNFIFQVTGHPLTDIEVAQINNIDSPRKIRDRVQAIYSKGNSLKLKGFSNQIFKNNLILIDSLLPSILANALILFYKDEIVKLSEVSDKLTTTNPLSYDQSLNHKFYDHKLKRFLSEVALGMVPNTTWSGLYNGTEGYIVVKENGEIVCYHIINRNLFEDYLLVNTKMETPSSSRHAFGELYNDNSGTLLFRLNLQVRFL
jgi:hypothetical protein